MTGPERSPKGAPAPATIPAPGAPVTIAARYDAGTLRIVAEGATGFPAAVRYARDLAARGDGPALAALRAGGFGRYPLRLSARNAAGYDAGTIHAAYVTPAGAPVALCGAPFGRNGTAEHDIGPTCRRCRAELSR